MQGGCWQCVLYMGDKNHVKMYWAIKHSQAGKQSNQETRVIPKIKETQRKRRRKHG
jgi:hypothetical protein